jgi:hypothetical protein
MRNTYVSSFCLILILTGLFSILRTDSANAQIKIGTNGATIAPSSLLELESANQGLLLPRMADTVAINALNPPNGMLIYLTKVPAVGLYVRKVTGWEYLTGSLGGNANFTSVTVSGTVTAGSFSGSLTGNATTATTAITATNSINSAVTNDVSTTAVTYPTFVTITPGNTGLRTSNTNLSYVPSTGVLTAMGFRGPLTGNVTGTATLAIDATNAANTAITNNITTNALHFPTFVSGTTGNLPHQTSSPNFTFNPSTGTVSALGFNGNLTGNSTTATNATTTTITDDIITAAAVFPTFVTNTSGNWGQRTAGSKLSFVPSTGVLTATGFVSTEPTGLPPLVVASSTVVANLSATNAVNTVITNDVATNLPVYPTFVSGTTGNLGHRTASSRLSFIPFTGALTASSFNGPLIGNANSATNVTGIVAIVNGGTGASTKAIAFDALSPMTIAGDIIYMNAAGTGTRLPVGAATTFLKGGALPTWSSIDLASGEVTGIVPSNKGGTGVNNANTLTLSGANISFAATGLTNITLPTSGTLATLAGIEPLTNKTINGNTIAASSGTLNMAAGSTLATSGINNSITLTSTGATSVILPTTGTLTTLAGIEPLTNKTINGNTITAGSGTLTMAAGSTLATSGINNSITLISTGATNVTLPTTGILVAAISNSASIDFPPVTIGSADSPTPISVPGAVDGDTISLGVPNSVMLNGAAYVAWVSSPGNVTVRFINYKGTLLDPPIATFNVKVFK